jgi:hypothetical protein
VNFVDPSGLDTCVLFYREVDNLGARPKCQWHGIQQSDFCSRPVLLAGSDGLNCRVSHRRRRRVRAMGVEVLRLALHTAVARTAVNCVTLGRMNRPGFPGGSISNIGRIQFTGSGVAIRARLVPLQSARLASPGSGDFCKLIQSDMRMIPMFACVCRQCPGGRHRSDRRGLCCQLVTARWRASRSAAGAAHRFLVGLLSTAKKPAASSAASSAWVSTMKPAAC